MTTSVVIDGARTPIGRLLGAFASLSAVDLGAIAIRGALERAGVRPDQVDAVAFGEVFQAGSGPNPARRAAVAAGLPMSVPAVTVNKLCLSGLYTVAMADQMIRCGQHEVVVTGGMESMTAVPHLLLGARQGYKYGNAAAVDALEQDGLICAFDGLTMGAATEQYGRPLAISRAEQDDFAERSHRLAAEATASGRLAQEIVPVEVTGRKGVVTVTEDEGIRPDTTLASLGALRPAFDPDGAITAGNASQISDGACALVVASKEWAQGHGLPWIAELISHGEVAGPDPSLLLQPSHAISDALRREGSMTVDDLDIVEINEAFAAVAIASMRDLGVSEDRVNVRGGAIALGHPVGMSGARILLSAAYELRNRGGGIGAVALCGGGGQGEAIVFSTPAP